MVTMVRAGVYLGHSPLHTGSVALSLNTRTGHVYYQYHALFDNTLSTVEHMRKLRVPGNWKNLVEYHSDLAKQENFTLEKEWYLKKSSSMNLPREACQ